MQYTTKRTGCSLRLLCRFHAYFDALFRFGLAANQAEYSMRMHNEQCGAVVRVSFLLNWAYTHNVVLSSRLFARYVYPQSITSTFARSITLSGVKLYNSSISAGRKVPGPNTSGLAAASSDAMVTARTLVSI
jgi:hypothetical protein